jgi:hypothetical protein
VETKRSSMKLAMAAALLLCGGAATAGIAGQGTWETTLQPRDINGDGTVDAFYDTALKVSWLAERTASSGLNWWAAKDWAASLNVYGVTGWRLPTMTDTGGSGCDFSSAGGTDCGANVQTISDDGKTVYSEMAHLFYVSLGNLSVCAPGSTDCRPLQPGSGLSNSGAFRNLQPWWYWSGLAYEPSPTFFAWHFSLSDGGQGYSPQHDDRSALAVLDGDVAALVPEPSSYGLLMVGLAGIVLVIRRRPPSTVTRSPSLG